MARPPQASARGLFVRLDNGSWLRIRVFSTEEMLERIRING